MKTKKRLLSLLLCGAMLFSLCSQSVLAEGSVQTDGGVTIRASGLCEHHPEHDANCGYTEGTPETPCGHEHTEDCYTEVTECVHEHDEGCYPEEAENSVSEGDATPSDAEEREPENCPHICDEESGCITKELNCTHEHDDECGYTPATEGTPCGYVCEICGAEDSGNYATPSDAQNTLTQLVITWEWVDPEEYLFYDEDAEAWKLGLPGASETNPAMREDIVSLLPESITATLGEEQKTISLDGWTCESYPETGAGSGSYTFTAALPEGYDLDGDAPALAVTTELGGIQLYNSNDTVTEQFSNLVPGETYWFNLSGESIPGTVNSSLPDTSFTWVPFTYVGTINAYVLNSEANGVKDASDNASSATDSGGQYGYTYDHSLFIADYDLSYTVTWNDLNSSNLIFGKEFVSGGVTYQLRVPTGGNDSNARLDSGTPANNEWDSIRNKDGSYIKNAADRYTWCQDTPYDTPTYRVSRKTTSILNWGNGPSWSGGSNMAFHPVLEIPNTDTLGNDELQVVTLDLGENIIGSSEEVKIVVKSGEGLTIPDISFKSGHSVAGWYIDDTFSAKWDFDTDTVSQSITLYAKWEPDTYDVTLDAGNGTINSGKDITSYTYGIGATLPGADDLTYPGYTFIGWYESSDFSGTPVVEISDTDTGEKVFYAKWVDITAPTLTDGHATRTDEANATVIFTSDEAGTYYFAIVESGAAEPTIATTGTGAACAQGENTISLTALTGAGAKDIYIVVKDAANNVSDPLKITIPLFPVYELELSPATHDFGSLKEGYVAPAAQTVTITNKGNQTVTLTQPTAADYEIGTLSKTELAPGGTATFTVQPKTGFTKGTYSETITISDNGGATADFTPSFIVTVPVLEVTAPTFDNVQEGYTQPEAKPLTIENTGDADAAISKVEVDNTTAFEIGGNGDTAAAGGSITTWTIRPKTGLSNSTYKATITVSYDNGKTATTQVSFTVTAAPVLEVADPTFDSMKEGYTQPTVKAITIKNTGGADAAISKVGVDNTTAFEISGSGSTVTAGGSITTWTIQPKAGLSKGTYTGTITVTYDGGRTATAGVSFTVTAPVLNVTAPAFDRVQEDYTQPEAKPITIENTGDADATISKVEVDSSDFEIGGSGDTVAAGGSITTWTVQPKAGLSKGTYTGTITVAYDDGKTATAQVSFAVSAPNLIVTAPTFDEVQEDYAKPTAKVIAIENTGNATATISKVEVDNTAFEIGGSGSTVAAGGSITSWTVQPQAGLAIGTYTGTIIVTYDNGAEATATVSFAVAEKSRYTAALNTDSLTNATAALSRTADIEAGDIVTLTITPASGYTFQTAPTVTVVGAAAGAVTAGTDGGYTCEITGFTGNAAITVNGNAEAIAPVSKIVQEDLTEVPEGLKNTSFDTVEKIENELTRILTAASGYTTANTAVYDVKLQISTDGGKTWIDATEANFPASGITVVIPYPSGTGKTTHDFTVTHMFTVTSSVLGTTAGQTEQPTVTKTDEGIRVTLKGLSPVGIAWKTISSGGSSGGGGGGGSTTYYTLTFETNGGSSIEKVTGTYGKTIDLSSYAPTRDGYDFSGWYSDKELTNKITEIRLTGNQTVYAGWTERKENPNTGAGNPFTDVKETDWFYDDVMFVYENGLMAGTSATTFEPYSNTTRAQIAVIFYRMEGSPAVEGKNDFADVEYGPGTAWYYDAVTWAQQSGIMAGYGDGTFGPNDPVTREQLTSIFYRYAQYKGYDTTQGGMAIREFDDYESISSYAVDAMTWAVNVGIMSGKGNNLLDPKGTATRAEIAAMLHRFIEKYKLVPAASTTGSSGTGSGTSGWVQRTGSPLTGDGSNMGLWLFTLCTSAGALAALLIFKRREEEERGMIA